tara:strand:+ start:580 stop:885 length:306 start_codon:yes stop_codon:yes gene_type:complete
MIDDFNSENAQKLSDLIIDLLNEYEGTIVEKVFAVTHALHAIGETLYDKDDVRREALENDYNNSPSWPVALMLTSYVPSDLLKEFIQIREEQESTQDVNKC